jgi:tetratricopeptide (TPR) repeat protein/predicted Ser/Thr protein kinase
MATNSTPGGVACRTSGREDSPHAEAGGQGSEFASGGPETGFAPPFRALLGTPAAPAPGPKTPANDVDLPQVPGYELIEELGRGGMGVVYLARQRSLGRLVALKMILAGLHADSTARQRFRTEAEALARMQHPNVVQIHEVGEHDGKPFLSLEHVEGGSLLRKAAGTPQPDREAARVVETIARAVDSLHRRGVLHRDLKPSNVLLTADGTPKVTDFGLAKILEADGPTRTEAFLGTPSYAAPEQAAGDSRKVKEPADVYSLGAILYELLTGRPPFQGPTPLSILEQVRTQEPAPPRRLRSTVSADLETVCLKCLEKQPHRRYASAGALADDLSHFLDGQPVHARPLGAGRRLWRAVRRRPALAAWALVAAALVCLALTAWAYFRAADRLAGHRAEEKYRQFAQRRDEALVYGLLAPDEGVAFLGGEPADNLKKAESAAREALALAGVDVESGASIDPAFPGPRKEEAAADCYALLLLLAGIRAQEPAPQGVAAEERRREALRILDRARQLGFRTRAYHARRAHLLEQLGEKEEARKDSERAASVPPQGALDHFLAGEELYRRGDYQQAASSFDRALGRQPGHFWARFFLAVCHLKARHWEAAKAGLNACLSQQPDFVWAYLFRSFANQRLGALAEAEADFQEAFRLEPTEDARYALLLTRGILHFEQSELRRAEADFRSAMALKPGQYNAYLSLAQVHLARGEFEAAAELVTTALRFRPPTQALAAYHLGRARALLRGERYEEAVAACAAALELSPQQAPPEEVCGRALLALGRYEQAEGAFDRHLRKGGAKTTDLFRGRGLARMKLGKCPEAAEDYTRALELAPDAEVYQHRGWAHFFCDAWKLALRDFAKAIELDPSAGDAHVGRGLARVMLGDYRGAAADAEVALVRQPRTPEMMHNVACIFAQAAARAVADGQEEDRRALAESYRGRAVRAVRQTLAMVRPDERRSFWKEKILPDPALAPVRDDAEFRRLQQEIVRSR